MRMDINNIKPPQTLTIWETIKLKVETQLTARKKLTKIGPWIKSPFNGVKGLTPYLHLSKPKEDNVQSNKEP